MQQVEKVVDIAVIGARVAGSATAIRLARAGHRVALIDSATFPSDTVSTHFFRGAGLIAVLDRLGLLGAVLALGSPPLTREYTFVEGDATPSIGEPQDPGEAGFCLSVRRLPLDSLLVSAARATPGVEVLEATSARSLRVEQGRVTGVTVAHAGVTSTISARLVVGADGRGSAVARWVDAPEERREPALRAMYFRYVRGFRGPGDSWDGPVFSFRGDELAYAFPGDDGITCIALSVGLAAFSELRLEPEQGFEACIDAHPGLAEPYRRSMRIGRLLGAGPRDAVVRRPFGPGWALVGDAGMSQDPWTGLGMDNAGTHAMFLADAIDEWLSERSDQQTALAGYQRRRDEHALPGFDLTAEGGRDLSILSAH